MFSLLLKDLISDFYFLTVYAVQVRPVKGCGAGVIWHRILYAHQLFFFLLLLFLCILPHGLFGRARLIPDYCSPKDWKAIITILKCICEYGIEHHVEYCRFQYTTLLNSICYWKRLGVRPHRSGPVQACRHRISTPLLWTWLERHFLS